MQSTAHTYTTIKSVPVPTIYQPSANGSALQPPIELSGSEPYLVQQPCQLLKGGLTRRERLYSVAASIRAPRGKEQGYIKSNILFWLSHFALVGALWEDPQANIITHNVLHASVAASANCVWENLICKIKLLQQDTIPEFSTEHLFLRQPFQPILQCLNWLLLFGLGLHQALVKGISGHINQLLGQRMKKARDQPFLTSGGCILLLFVFLCSSRYF